ncbi:MAG: hypothetical protein IKS54_05160 [Erysipelotrichaceae bacterium]|nr:hypothetical protein [Erysipelotrichaceae bacterium]
MRYLYYCNSTYQLLNVLNLNWHRKNAGFESIDDYKADLLILNSFSGAKETYEIIKKQEAFEHVKIIDKAFNQGIFHSIKTVMDALSPSFYLRDKYQIRSAEIKNRYDVICAPKYSLVVDQIWRINPKAKLHLIEDGIGSYFLDIPFASNSRLISKLSKNDFHDYDALYLVDKDLYLSDNPERVVEIPVYDHKYLEQIKEAFSSFDIDDCNDRKIFWLSQFLNNVKFNEMVDEVLDSLVEYKEDLVFCQHPRNPMKNVHGFKESDNRQIWEFRLLNMRDIEEKLFISIHSTACFSAKMLYDMEPYVILFYKLGDVEVTHVTDEFEEVIKRFKQSYRDPDKIVIPETLDEFKEAIRRFMKR